MMPDAASWLFIPDAASWQAGQLTIGCARGYYHGEKVGVLLAKGWGMWSWTVAKLTEQETCIKHSLRKMEFFSSLLILEQTIRLLARVACGSTQQDTKQQALPWHTEARSHLCSGLSVLHLASDTSSHYCPRKVLAHLLYNPWGRFSPSLLTLFMSHCWNIWA